MRRRSAFLGILIAAGIVALAGCSVAARPFSQASLTNGRLIFQTGVDARGVRIVARSHPLFGSCAACHNADGSGGKRLPGGAVSADLRYSTLVESQKHPYTLSLLERAISTGVDNQGRSLSLVMPRWRLSSKDLHDVSQYVLERFRGPSRR